jgi:hypothetical protein
VSGAWYYTSSCTSVRVRNRDVCTHRRVCSVNGETFQSSVCAMSNTPTRHHAAPAISWASVRISNMIMNQSPRIRGERRSCPDVDRRGFAARDFDLGGGFHYSGSYPMVFQHSGARDFDLGGGFHYSGSYPMVFQHSGARDFDLGGGFHYSGSYPLVFQHSGARDFDLGGGFHYSGSYPMVFQHSGLGVRTF